MVAIKQYNIYYVCHTTGGPSKHNEVFVICVLKSGDQPAKVGLWVFFSKNKLIYTIRIVFE